MCLERECKACGGKSNNPHVCPSVKQNAGLAVKEAAFMVEPGYSDVELEDGNMMTAYVLLSTL